VAGFDSAWCGTDLGEYRPCPSTYGYYPYESLPPVDSAAFTGDFAWLGGTAPPPAAASGRLTLPGDFVTFLPDARLRRSLEAVSVTGCRTDISDPLPSPVEPGAFLVRFLRDQQDCVIWYLYVRRDGAAFVVHSSVDYADESDDPEEQRTAIHWCAPSFEEFAYRFWAENRLWRALHGGDLSTIEPQLRDYLRHYMPTESGTRV
jgi:hypothetical protein